MVRSVDRAPVGAGPDGQLEHQAEHVARIRMRLAASVRSRTPAKIDSMGLLVRRWIQCFWVKS